LQQKGRAVPIQGLKILAKKNGNNGNGFLMANGWR